MIAVIRNKFGPILVGGVIALIAFVFIFYGLFVPGVGPGASGPSVAGTVNGEVITFSEYSRTLNQKLEFFRNIMGGKVSEEQLARFNVRDMAFQELAQQKLSLQVAHQLGFQASSEAVRDQILSMKEFQLDGRFDKLHYKNLLAQNQFSVSRFEKLINDSVTQQQFQSFLNQMALVSELDLEKEIRLSKERRKFRYVYLENEAIRKSLKEGLPDAEKEAVLKSTLDSLVTRVTPLVSGKNSETAVNNLLKAYSIKMKNSESMTLQTNDLPGVGPVPSIRTELFALGKNEKARSFNLIGGTLVIAAVEVEKYDPATVSKKDRLQVRSRLASQKQGAISADLMKYWKKTADISSNPKVVSGNEGVSLPLTLDQ